MGNWYGSKPDNDGERELIDRAVKALEAELATKTCNKQIVSKLEDAELARDSEETCNNKQVTSKLVASEDIISRQAVLESIKNLYPDMPVIDIMGARRKWLKKYAPYFECENAVEHLPSVTPKQEPRKDAVSLGVFEQVMWERDVAIEQLKELGYGFGEKIRTDDDSISRQAVLDLAVKIELPDGQTFFCISPEDVEALPSVNPKQRTGWIPVSEPPKKLGTYLIQTDGEYMCECRWTDVNPYWTDKKTKPHWNIFDIPQYSKVVAWMPLPEPYKAESEEQA